MLRLLYIGDIVGETGIRMIEKNLPDLLVSENIDFCCANAENISNGLGVSKKGLKKLETAGINFFSSGNHVWDNGDIYFIFNEKNNIIRPANYPEGVPGNGYQIIEIENNGIKTRILFINLLGRLFLAKVNCPFKEVEEILAKEQGNFDLSIVDFHAEATAEKEAMGFFLDGRVSLVLGTHTHVMTNDDKILPGGTAYITDIGMTGAKHSVIGVTVDPVIQHLLNRKYSQWKVEDSSSFINGIIVELDPHSGGAISIKKLVKMED